MRRKTITLASNSSRIPTLYAVGNRITLTDLTLDSYRVVESNSVSAIIALQIDDNIYYTCFIKLLSYSGILDMYEVISTCYAYKAADRALKPITISGRNFYPGAEMKLSVITSDCDNEDFILEECSVLHNLPTCDIKISFYVANPAFIFWRNTDIVITKITSFPS